jgi:cytochrome P450
MKSKLALTPEQTQTVADLNLKYANRMEPIIKGSSSSLTKMFQMRKINNEKETELKRILSPQQWEKFDASRDEMRQQFEAQIEKRTGTTKK